MAQPGVYQRKEGLILNAREPLNRARRRDERTTGKIQRKSVLTRKSPQVSDQSVPRGLTQSAGHGPVSRNIRVSTPGASANTSPADTSSQISRSKCTQVKAGTGCSRTAERFPRAVAVKAVREPASCVTTENNRETKNSAGGGVATVNRKRAMMPVEGTNRAAAKGPVRQPEKHESKTNTVQRTRRREEAKRSVVGSKQEEQAMPLNCRAIREFCTAWSTGGNHLEARKPANAQPVNREVTLEAKRPARPPAPRAHSAARNPTRCLFTNLTPASFLEFKGKEHIHRHLPSGSGVCQQGSKLSCRSASQHAADFPLETPTGSRDVSQVHGDALTLLQEVVPAATPTNYTPGRDGALNDVFHEQPFVASTSPASKPPPSANGRGLLKGTWCACKPFPKRDAVVRSKSSVRPCSSVAPGKGAAVPKTVLETKHVKPCVTFETHTHNGCLSPRRPVRVSHCTGVSGSVQEQQELSTVEFTNVTQKEKRGHLLKEKTDNVEEQPRIRGVPAQRPPAGAATRTVKSSGSVKPAVPACAPKNQASSRTRPQPAFKSTALSGHVLQARARQANPYQLTISREEGKPSHCCVRTETKSPSNPEKRAVPKCFQAQGSRNLKANAGGCVASRTAKRHDAPIEGELSQLQQQRQRVAHLSKNSCPVGPGQTKDLSSLASTGSATLHKSACIAVPERGDGGNQPPLMGLKSIIGEKHVHMNVIKAGAPTGKLPKLNVASKSETRSKPKPIHRLEDCQRSSAPKQGQRPLTPQNTPKHRSLKRYPPVPPLPLHLLPEILARKDAEEEAFRRAHGYSLDEHEDEFGLVGLQHRPCTHFQNKPKGSELKADSVGLKGRTARQSATKRATTSSSAVSSLQLDLFARTSPQSGRSNQEEVHKNSPDGAAKHVPAKGHDELWSNNSISAPQPSKHSTVSPDPLAQDKYNSQIAGGTEAETPTLSLVPPHLPPLSLPQCRSYEGGSDLALRSEYDMQCRGLQHSIRQNTPQIAVRLAQLAEAELTHFTRADVHPSDGSLSRMENATCETLSPFPADNLLTSKNLLHKEVSHNLSTHVRKSYDAGPFSQFSINQVAKEGCNPRSHLRHKDLSNVPVQVEPQAHSQVEALDATLKADPQRQLHCNVPYTLANDSLKATHRVHDSSQERVVRRKEPCQRSGSDLSRLRRQAFSQTKSGPKDEALPTLQPPRLNAYSHIGAARVQSRETTKQGQRGSCSSHAGVSSLASSQHQRPQRPMPRNQPEMERVARAQSRGTTKQGQRGSCSSHVGALSLTNAQQKRPQRSIPNSQPQVERSPIQTNVQQPQRDPRNALKAGESIAERNRQRTLLGEKHAAGTALSLPMKRQEDENLPRTRKSTQKGNGSQILPCVGNAKGRSASRKCQQNAIPESRVNASQRSAQHSKERPLHHDSKRPLVNSTLNSLSIKKNNPPCASQLLIPLENHLQGLEQGQGSQHPSANTVRPAVLHTPWSLCGTEAATNQRDEGPHIVESQLQEEFNTRSMKGVEPDLPFTAVPKCATRAAGNHTSHFLPEVDLSTLKRGGAPTTPLVATTFGAPCTFHRFPEKLVPHIDTPLQGDPCATSEAPPPMSLRHPSCAIDAALSTSIRPSVTEGIVRDRFCSSGIARPVETPGLVRQTQQRSVDHRLCPLTDAGILGVLRQPNISSQNVEVHHTRTAFTDTAVEGSQRGQSVTYCSSQGQEATSQDYEVSSAVGQPFKGRPHYEHMRPSSSERNDEVCEQTEVQHLTFTQQNSSRTVVPLDSSSSSVQRPAQQLTQLRIGAQMKPPTSAGGHSEKPVTGRLPHCTPGSCRVEASTSERDPFLPTTYGIRHQKDWQHLGVLPHTVPPQLCPPLCGNATPWPPRPEKTHDVAPLVGIPLNAHLGTYPQQLRIRQAMCTSGPFPGVSCSDLALQLHPPQRAFLHRLKPAAVICRQ